MSARLLPLIVALSLFGAACSASDDRSVASADEASELVADFFAAQSAYFSDGAVGDAARIEDLTSAVSEHWVEGINFDPSAAHACYVELLDQLRPLVDPGGVLELSLEDVNVVDVDGELWVVQYDAVTFITGVGEIVDAGATFVSPDGIVGQRQDESGEPGCLDRSTEPDASVRQLAAMAAAADR